MTNKDQKSKENWELFNASVLHGVIEQHHKKVNELRRKCPCTDCAKWRTRND